jgi:hypothetical protein
MRLIFSQDPRLKMHIKASPLTHKSEAPRHYRRGFWSSFSSWVHSFSQGLPAVKRASVSELFGAMRETRLYETDLFPRSPFEDAY